MDSTPPVGDMPTEEFRAAGHQLVDWIADQFSASLERPILPHVEPGSIRAALPQTAPVAGAEFADILADFERVLVPGLTQWNHPKYFAYFPCGFSAPGVLADFLSTAMSQQAMLWRTSPASTELEAVVLDWLRRAIGLPAAFEGVIYDTASTGAVHALVAARHAARPDVRTAGSSAAPVFRVYCSEHAHSSIDKAVITVGLGHENLRRVAADSNYRMRPDALEQAIAGDRRAGKLPLAVVATAGTTSSASVDPVGAIADICGQEKLWLHVDAAYAGVAAILPECQAAMRGMERADSVVINPHKWLFTPFDCSTFFSPRMDVLRAAFALTPEYLKTSDDPAVRNLMDTGFQLGRRFRSLKLWTVMRYFGLEGLRARLREHIRLARLAGDWIDADPGFERVTPVNFGVVCFRAVRANASGEQLDALNEQLMEKLNDSGQVFLSHSRLDGRLVLRLAIGNIRTTERDVREAWELIRSYAAAST